MSEGDACSSGCGYCGRCDRGPAANASCSDCGDLFVKGYDDVGSLCDVCCDQRDAHTEALERRLAAGPPASLVNQSPWFNAAGVVDVAIVPVSIDPAAGVVEVALVPMTAQDALGLKRMAKAVLAADLTRIQEIA